MSRWEHRPYDPHGGEGLGLIVCVITILGSLGTLFWVLGRTG